MAVVQGRIEKTYFNEGPYGKLYGFVVNGVRYGIGKSDMGLRDGDWVSLEAEQKGQYWNAVKGSIKPIEAPAGASKNVTKAPTAGAATSSYNDTRQDSIIYQSSRKDALEFLRTLQISGLIDMGKSKDKASQQAIMEAYLDKYTEHFIEEVKANKPHAMQSESLDAGVKGRPKPLGEDDPGDDLSSAF